MKLEQFLAARQDRWRELDELIRAARGKAERLGPDRLRMLGSHYRSAAADLSLGRRHFPGDPAVARLEQLVLQARALVYGTRRSSPLRGFLTRRYWELVRGMGPQLAVAASLLLLPATAAAVWGLVDPAAAAGLVPADFAGVLDPGPEGTDQAMTVAEQAAFSGLLFTNNIQVTFLAFAGGILAGVGTVLLVVYNGLILGAVAGVVTEGGDGAFFVELVAAHGVLELSAIVVTAAAGLHMGWAIVEPGTATRRGALVAAARRAVLVVIGTMPWLVVAGLIEAFVSRRGAAALPMAVVGVVVGAGYWLAVWRRGAPAPGNGSAYSRARRLAAR